MSFNDNLQLNTSTRNHNKTTLQRSPDETVIGNADNITVLHCMQRGLSYEHLSVRPSVKRVNCDKTNESSAEILIPHER